MIDVMCKDMGWDNLTYLQGENDFASDIMSASIEVGKDDEFKTYDILADADAEGKPLWLRYMTRGSKGPKNMHRWGWSQHEEGKWHGRHATLRH